MNLHARRRRVQSGAKDSQIIFRFIYTLWFLGQLLQYYTLVYHTVLVVTGIITICYQCRSSWGRSSASKKKRKDLDRPVSADSLSHHNYQKLLLLVYAFKCVQSDGIFNHL